MTQRARQDQSQIPLTTSTLAKSASLLAVAVTFILLFASCSPSEADPTNGSRADSGETGQPGAVQDDASAATESPWSMVFKNSAGTDFKLHLPAGENGGDSGSEYPILDFAANDTLTIEYNNMTTHGAASFYLERVSDQKTYYISPAGMDRNDSCLNRKLPIQPGRTFTTEFRDPGFLDPYYTGTIKLSEYNCNLEMRDEFWKGIDELQQSFLGSLLLAGALYAGLACGPCATAEIAYVGDKEGIGDAEDVFNMVMHKGDSSLDDLPSQGSKTWQLSKDNNGNLTWKATN